jgi:hypothetical protein
MLGALGSILGRTSGSPPPRRFPWFEKTAVATLARDAGMSMQRTDYAELAIRDSSPEAYVAGGQEHPMALAARPVLRQAGVDGQASAAMAAVLRQANEDAAGFLVHSPYVVHELRAG